MRTVLLATLAMGRRSPLRRSVDRVQIAVHVATVALAGLAVPLAVMIGGTVHRHDLAAAARSVGAQQVTAILRDGVPAQPTLGGMPSTASASATWRTRGRTHTGAVQVMPPAAAGTRVTVWVDADGDTTSAPMSTGYLRYREILVTGTSLVLGLFVVAVFAFGVRYKLNALRSAAWERGWRIVEPLWTSRLPDPPST